MKRAIAFAVLLVVYTSVASAWTYHDEARVLDVTTGVPAAVLERLAWSESSYNPNAVNPSDPSAGLMGLSIPLLPWLSRMFYHGERIDPFDPYASMIVAARYLAWLHERMHEGASWYWTVLDYKAGMDRVKSTNPWGENVPLMYREIAWWVAWGDSEVRNGK